MCQLIGLLNPGQFHRRTHEDIICNELLPELAGSLLTECILDQGALQFLLGAFGFLRLREERNGLDPDQTRCHFQKFPGKIQILPLSFIYIQQILLQQLCDLDVIDIKLMLGNEVEQQVEGTCEDIELEL